MFRSLSRVLHPDVDTGDHQLMSELLLAREQLMSELLLARELVEAR